MQQQQKFIPENLPAPFRILGMIGMIRLYKAMHAVVELGIPDLLQEGVKSTAQLAAETSTHEETLYRLLRAVAAIGVLNEVEEQVFKLTELSSYLCKAHPQSVRDILLWTLSDCQWNAINSIGYAVRTGSSAFEHANKMNVWSYLVTHPDVDAVFNGAMTALTKFAQLSPAQLYDFSSAHTVADLGGGNGSLLADILKANPSVRGILLERASVIEEAKVVMARQGLTERCQLIAGDVLDGVPQEADVYIMKHFLHGRDTDRSIQILQSCRNAMTVGQKVLLIEQVLTAIHASPAEVAADLLMLLSSEGGKERTASEYQNLLEASGFQLSRIIPSNTPDSIVEGVAI